MENLTFWRNFSKPIQYVFFFLATVSLILFTGLIVGIFSDNQFIISWDSNQELTTIPIDFEKFTSYYHEFKIQTLNYLTYENYVSEHLKINSAFAYFYLAAIAISVVFFLTFSTLLSKWYYYASMFGFMLFLATLNLDLLEIIDPTKKHYLTLLIILFVGSNFAIYSFYSHLSIIKKLLIFSAITIALGFLTFTASNLNPTGTAFHIVAYGSASFILLTVTYIVFIAFENVAFINYLHTYTGNRNKGNLLKFFALNIFYLAMLAVIYFSNRGFLNEGFFGISAFAVLIFAGIVSFWGMYKRLEDFEFSEKVGVYLIFLTLKIIAISTLAYNFLNANSSLIGAFEDIICIVFFGLGLAFFLYTLINFLTLLHQKAKVYLVLYKPAKFSLFHTYVFGITASIILILQQNKYSYWQSISGYYNNLGDYYYKIGNLLLAEPFYEEALSFDYTNHHTNYALSSIHLKKGNQPKATEHLLYANLGNNTSEHIYITLGNIYRTNNKFFEALFTLGEGTKRFPESPYLYNNMGILYKKTDIIDSTIYSFGMADEFSGNQEIPFNNLLTFLLKNDLRDAAKKMIEDQKVKETKSVKTAISTFNAKNGIFNAWKGGSLLLDTNLNYNEFSYFYNHALNNILMMDSSFSKKLDSMIYAPSNTMYNEYLLYLRAFYDYYNQDIVMARAHMATLAGSTSFYAGYYNNLLGMWMLQQKNFELAEQYFSVAEQYKFNEAKFNLAFTQTLLEKHEEATEKWQELSKGKDSKNLAETFIKAIQNNPKISEMNDNELFYHAVFNKNAKIEEFINFVSDEKIKKLLHLELAKKQIKNGNFSDASNTLKNINEISTEPAFALLNAEIKINTEQDIEKTLQELDKIEFPSELKAEYLLLKSRALMRLNNQEKTSESVEILINSFPFYEDGLLTGINFYKQNKNNEKAYEIATSALKVISSSTEILKQYALLSIDLGLGSYAESALYDLSDLLSEEEYLKFKQIFDVKKAEFDKKINEWSQTE